MNIYARAQSSVLSWIYDTPLPTTTPEAFSKFQYWHHFHHPAQQWIPIRATDNTSKSPGNVPEPPRSSDRSWDLVHLTWNIDAGSVCARERATDIVTYITQLDPKVDIIFLQEVSKSALSQILMDDRVRGSWFSSEGDDAAWGTQRFSSMTLLSKTRFAPSDDASNAVLGPIWRAPYPSRYGRDALCCDIFIPCFEESSGTRIRLVNVHLDSLPLQPSYRPQQLSIVSSLLRSAGRGLVAGDFNPVLDEDATLLENNGLVDAWTTLHPNEPGYTWGTDDKQRFPPNRLDKVALVGLKAHTIKILAPKRLGEFEKQQNTQTDEDTSKSQLTQPTEVGPFWSDHHGLVFSFGLADE